MNENCRHLMASLSEYVDGELNELLCAELESHLSGCDNCRIVVDTLRKTIDLYKEPDKTEGLPEDVRERLFYRLNLTNFME